MANQNEKIKIKTLYFLKMLYTGCFIKEAILLFISWSTIISRKKDFYTFTSVQKWQNKINKLELGHSRFSNCYIQGTPRKKQYHCFFRRTPKISRINDFYRSILGELWEIKIKKNKISTLYILKLLFAGCSTKEAISFFPSRSI